MFDIDIELGEVEKEEKMWHDSYLQLLEEYNIEKDTNKTLRHIIDKYRERYENEE